MKTMTMNEAFYALGRGELDPMKLLIAFAEKCPDTFLAVLDETNDLLAKAVKKVYGGVNGDAGNFIEAIKHYRACTGASLVEAKAAVEKITGHPTYNPFNRNR